MWWLQACYLVLISGDHFTACWTSSTSMLLRLHGLPTFFILGCMQPVSYGQHSREVNVLWFGCRCCGYLSAYRLAVVALLCSASPYSNVTWGLCILCHSSLHNVSTAVNTTTPEREQ
jgi:hypothetical protein